MDRYFFDLEDADGLTTDEAGLDFPTLDEMHRAAVDELHELSRDDGGSQNMHTRIRVRDAAGKVMSFVSQWAEGVRPERS